MIKRDNGIESQLSANEAVIADKSGAAKGSLITANDCIIDGIAMIMETAKITNPGKNAAKILLDRCAAKACFAYDLISCLDLI